MGDVAALPKQGAVTDKPGEDLDVARKISRIKIVNLQFKSVHIFYFSFFFSLCLFFFSWFFFLPLFPSLTLGPWVPDSMSEWQRGCEWAMP
uniref:Uncharacterized protein n=1 Tax=Candidozyma auris TaxID=498019 RepID=A0A0L0NSW4_CANAR